MSRPSGQTTDTEPLEQWEYLLILSHLAAHWRLLYELLEEIGIRLGEALAITRADLHAGDIWITSEKRADHLRRQIPISASLYSRIRIYSLSHKGERVWEFTGSAAWLALKKAAIAAGVRIKQTKGVTTTTIHPHLFRHGFAHRVERAGKPMNTIQGMLGHKSIQSTERYTKATKNEIMEAFREVNKRM